MAQGSLGSAGLRSPRAGRPAHTSQGGEVGRLASSIDTELDADVRQLADNLFGELIEADSTTLSRPQFQEHLRRHWNESSFRTDLLQRMGAEAFVRAANDAFGVPPAPSVQELARAGAQRHQDQGGPSQLVPRQLHPGAVPNEVEAAAQRDAAAQQRALRVIPLPATGAAPQVPPGAQAGPAPMRPDPDPLVTAPGALAGTQAPGQPPLPIAPPRNIPPAPGGPGPGAGVGGP